MTLFRDRVALLTGVPRVIRMREKLTPWTAERRMRVALANTVRGTWHVCLSTRSVADIERKFVEMSIPSILYEVVGGILGDHTTLKHTGKQHYLYVELARRDYYVDLALADIGIKPQTKIKFEQITNY